MHLHRSGPPGARALKDETGFPATQLELWSNTFALDAPISDHQTES